MGQNHFFVTGVWRAQTPSVCDDAKKTKKIFKHGRGPRPLSKNLGQNWDKTGTNGTKLGQMGQMRQMGQTGQNWDKWDKSWDKWDNLGQMETKPGTPRRNQNVGADDPGCLRLTGLSCAAQTATSENNVCSAEVPGTHESRITGMLMLINVATRYSSIISYALLHINVSHANLPENEMSLP